MKSTSSGFVRCQFCGREFIEEELRSHPCWVSRNPVKEVIIDFIYETEEPDGSKTTHAYDLNGNIYRLTKPNPAKLAELKRGESDGNLQEDYADWLRRRVDNTSKQEVYIPDNFPKKSINA